ncbi:hypothetical protein NQ314_007943 [Rhamnusium bicolor]|uniref:Uncharacterized protein n=1 Tax=Rhamnusium bicolor TaxID=1586634 RepID=A0AAV8YGL8_9CUCU|nr:hypothetical protein NQ314_007943 [Rhamnusium bicolor]
MLFGKSLIQRRDLRQLPLSKKQRWYALLPTKRPDISKIPIVEPPKSPRTPSPQPRRPISPMTPESPMNPLAHSTPISGSPVTAKPLEPPAKPPRSPSPHPIRTEAFEDIEYEEDEESSGVEEDDENSVISSSVPRGAQLSNSVEFLTQEANQSNSLRLNQTR